MFERLANLRQRVEEQPHFEGAARALLRGVLDEAARVAASIDPPVDVLRAAIHLRSGPGYRGLVVLDRTDADDAYALPSTTAWRWVQQGRAVAIDVLDAKVAPAGAPPRRTGEPLRIGPGTQEVFHGRSASHVYALPAYTVTDTIGAMISLEVAAPGWVQRPLPLWDALADFLRFATRNAAGLVLVRPLVPSGRIETDPLLPVVGASIEPVLDTLAKFARMDATVLLTGEPGVGKSGLARWVHSKSRRATGPFLRASLANEPADLATASLFGVERGAFTDARERRRGLLERAAGGTLFLDEIDCVSIDLQARLLEVLEEGSYRRLGDPDTDRTADVRFIVATNAPLEERVEAGSFRRDLYHRLYALPVHVPPLTDRRDEILPWARYFLAELELPDAVLDAGAEAALLGESYAGGNLRELRTIVQRAAALSLGQERSSIVVTGAEVARALQPSSSRPRLVRALRAAAVAWADAVVAGETGLRDETLDVFRQYVRRELSERVDPARGFEMLGLEGTVRGRSHTRKYREALVAVEEFERGR